MKTWYCEYKNGVRIHDYINIMINNFPIFTIRRYDFGVHSGDFSSTISVGILGFTKNFQLNIDKQY